MADSTTPIQQIVAGIGADAMVNDNFDAASPAMLYGRRASATTGLTWGYYGGRYKSNLIANGTVTLTPSATNYIVASKATGAVSVSTSTTNWNNANAYERLYRVVTGASGISSYEDHRQVIGSGSGADDRVDLVTEASAFTVNPATHAGLHRIVLAGGDVTFNSSQGYQAGHCFNIRATASLSLLLSGVTLNPPHGGSLDLDDGMTVTVVMTSGTSGFVLGQTVAA